MDKLDFSVTLFGPQQSAPTLERQPLFPEEDLTDGNAAFLDFYLQNDELVDAGHAPSEQRRRVFELAHDAASKNRLLEDPNQHASFAQGFTYFEVMHSLVTPEDTDPLHPYIATVAAEWLAVSIKSGDGSTFMIDTVDKFSEEQPKAAQVIQDAAKRLDPSSAHYAVVGAALERQIELETRKQQAKYGL